MQHGQHYLVINGEYIHEKLESQYVEMVPTLLYEQNGYKLAVSSLFTHISVSVNCTLKLLSTTSTITVSQVIMVALVHLVGSVVGGRSGSFLVGGGEEQGS